MVILLFNFFTMVKIYSLYGLHPYNDVEYVDPVSETIPDQSLSVREILTRYKRGDLSLSSPETGDDDDIDLDEDFDDLVDASEVLSDALSLRLDSDSPSDPPADPPTGAPVDPPAGAPVDSPSDPSTDNS